MNKGLIITIILTLAILVSGAYLLSKQSSSTLPAMTEADLPDHLEYYWGNGCPHCAVVQEFLDSWDKSDEIQIEKFETYYNKDNKARLNQRTAFCSIPPNQAGVPMLFTPSGECLIGDQPIIDYLKHSP